MARRKRRRYPYRGFGTHEEYLDAVWRERLGDLRAFERRFGHTRVPRGFAEDRSLGRWVAHQRFLYRLGDLRQDREKALRKVGFELVLPDAPVRVPWEVRYRELRIFKRRFGHTRVPAEWSESPQLARWVRTQRQSHRRGLLSRKRVRALRDLGFEWRLRRSRPWAEMYDRLRAFRRAHGHCDVSEGLGDPLLAHWVQRQRMLEREGRLRSDRRRKLARLGFRWSFELQRHSFADRLEQLRQFRRRHGHVNVPGAWAEDPSLPVWIANRRRAYRTGTLPAAHIAQLERLGVRFRVREASWEAMFEKLTRFRKRFGYARVPVTWKEDPKLARWVVKQRSIYREGGMLPERQKWLAALGFFEGLGADPWDASYEALCRYHSKHGHTRVSEREDAGLCLWLRTQRRQRRQGRLSRGKVRRLDALGFDWDPHESAWRGQLAKLRAYRARHGDCNVPHSWPRDPRLGFWVAQQRQRYHQGRLEPERVRALERLDFNWSPRAPHRGSRYRPRRPGAGLRDRSRRRP